MDKLWPCDSYVPFASKAAALERADSFNSFIPSVTFGRNKYEPFQCYCDSWHIEAMTEAGEFEPRVAFDGR